MSKTLVLLTQYKRDNLEMQLNSIYNQTLKPDYIIVFQNENHKDISYLKDKYNFIHVKSDYNTKYFGRFAYCLTFDVDYCFILDDDIIPAKNCLKTYLEECIQLNAIIGGNGRIGQLNSKSHILNHPSDVGIRNKSTLVDFVGHLWCFKKDWLYYMFSIKPYTYNTGEDMHFSFSSKVLGNINSYCSKQDNIEDISDITINRLAVDNHSSFLTMNPELRKSVEQYFIDNYGLNMIEHNNT